jgi:uncharacterized protein YkwD
LERPTYLLLALLLAATSLAACGSGGESSPTAAASLDPLEIEYESLRLVNNARSAEGVRPELSLEESLARVARAHSRAMRDQGFFAHAGPDGAGLRRRLDAAGVSYRAAAENLVQVVSTSSPAQFAHQQLMSSAEHRDNILSSRYSLAGVGVARAGDTYWITQIFIRR